MKYKTLNDLIQERGIKKTAIARKISVTPRTLALKINGSSPLYLEEANIIHDAFFPDVPKDKLFMSKNTAASEG